MGIDQLASRCRGCGKILKARESCGVCAEAKRSSLYAKGVCSPEAMLARDADRVMAEDRARHERELAAAVDHLAGLNYIAVVEACSKLSRGERLGVGCDYVSTVLECQRQLEGIGWHADRTRSRATSPGGVEAWFVRDPVAAQGMRFEACVFLSDAKQPLIDELRKRVKPSPEAALQAAFELVYRPVPAGRKTREVKFGRAYAGTWEDGTPIYTNACGMPSRTPEPPEVGEQVDYATALADMQARPEARYRHRGEVTVYGWSGGALMLHMMDDHSAVIGRSRTAAEDPSGPWQRLPDATTKPKAPEVGAVVSYEEALRDMQSNPSARYRHEIDREYGTRIRWDGGRLEYLDKRLGSWERSAADREVCESGTWRKLA